MTSLDENRAQAIRNTLDDALRRSVARNPAKIALIFGERQWTYHQLDLRVDVLATGLLAKGLRPGDRVAAFAGNSALYVLIFLACARAGLIHVPVNYALGAGELAYILEQSGSRALLYDPALADVVGQIRERTPVGIFCDLAGEEWLNPSGDDPSDRPYALSDASPATDHDVVQLLYTSGTTASPKGAMMTHRALLAEYTSAIVALDIMADDVMLAALPLYHSAQMHVFLIPCLLIGGTVVLLPAPVPEACAGAIARFGVTSFFAPPTVWIGFLRWEGLAGAGLSSLTKAYYGASIMPVAVLAELRDRLPRAGFYNCYGQSEIAPLATVLRPEDHDRRPASAGRPVFHVETRVVDPAMRDLPPGGIGEIVHRSPQLMTGYWDKNVETADAFAGGWFHSGDLGYFDGDGYLFIVDRVKDIIKTGGVVVSSREVEEALFTHPAVSEVAVVGLPDSRWIEAVTAFVVCRPGRTVGGDALITHARGQLAPFKLPKKVIFLEALPRNTAGKILKRALRQRYSNPES